MKKEKYGTTAYNAKHPPLLSNMMVVPLWLKTVWQWIELAQCLLFMISLLTEWMQKHTGAFCVSLDNILSISRSICKNKQRAFQGEEVLYPQLSKSITWRQSDWATFHLLMTRMKVERFHNSKSWRCLQWTPGTASPRTILWVKDFKQPSTLKIKYDFLWIHVYLSIGLYIPHRSFYIGSILLFCISILIAEDWNEVSQFLSLSITNKKLAVDTCHLEQQQVVFSSWTSWTWSTLIHTVDKKSGLFCLCCFNFQPSTLLF